MMHLSSVAVSLYLIVVLILFNRVIVSFHHHIYEKRSNSDCQASYNMKPHPYGRFNGLSLPPP
jgi:hypothetical protein